MNGIFDPGVIGYTVLACYFAHECGKRKRAPWRGSEELALLASISSLILGGCVVRPLMWIWLITGALAFVFLAIGITRRPSRTWTDCQPPNEPND